MKTKRHQDNASGISFSHVVTVFKNLKTLRNSMLYIASAAYCLLLLFILLGAVLRPRYSFIEYNTPLVAICAFFLAATVVLLAVKTRSWRPRLVATLIRRRAIITMLGIGLFLLHILVGHALVSNLAGWDPAVVNKASLQITQGQLMDDMLGYFITYPNNVGILLFNTTAIHIVNAFNMANLLEGITYINIIVMNLSLWVFYLIARRLYGTRIAIIGLLLFTPFIVLSPWSTTFYTDTVGMLFPLLMLYILIRGLAADRRLFSWGFYALSGSCAAVGYFIKPTAVVILAALYLVLLCLTLREMSKRAARRYGSIFVCSALGFVITGAILSLIVAMSGILPKDYVQRSNLAARPVSYFVMTGLNTSYRTYPTPPFEATNNPLFGAFSDEDNLADSQYATNTEKDAYAKEVIKQRLGAMGARGYMTFLLNKGAWLFSDGTFYSYGEGQDTGELKFYNHSPIDMSIRKYLYIKGGGYRITTYVFQILWYAILLLIIVQVFLIRRLGYDPVKLTIRITITGAVMGLLLIEGRSRYLYMFVPLFILVGLETMHTISVWYDELRIKKNQPL